MGADPLNLFCFDSAYQTSVQIVQHSTFFFLILLAMTRFTASNMAVTKKIVTAKTDN